MKQVISGLGVAVESAQAVKAAKGEAVDGLRRQVALSLAPAEQLVKPRARDELARQHARGAQLAYHTRDVDHRVRLVVVREDVLAFGLEPVVDLLAQPIPQLV